MMNQDMRKASAGAVCSQKISLTSRPSEKIQDVDEESVTENSGNSLSEVLKRGEIPSRPCFIVPAGSGCKRDQ